MIWRLATKSPPVKIKKSKMCLRPSVVVFSGVPLSGKTYLSGMLAASSNLKILDVDVVRNEIDATRKKDGLIRLLGAEEERKIMTQSYIELCRRAENVINTGKPVLIVGTFSRGEFKSPLKKLLNNLKKDSIPFKLFLLTVPDEEIEKRIESRLISDNLSNIDSLEKYRWAKGFFKEIRFAKLNRVDTSKQESSKIVFKILKDLRK